MISNLEDILEKCRSNDRKAQYALHKAWFPVLMKVAYRYKKNEEDAAFMVNLAFYKIFSAIDTYKTTIPFEAWSKRILMNTIIDEYRKEKKNIDLFKDVEDETLQNLNEIDYGILERELKVEQAEAMLNRLPENEKVVFNLYEIDGYSHKEIVEMIGISERSSKRHLANARQTLKKLVLEFTKTAYAFFIL